MKVADFELYKTLLYENSGLVITSDKSYLLDSRLTPVARKWNFPSIELMTLQLRALPDDDLIRDIVQAMTMTETSFFRDTSPFINFEQIILPLLIQQKSGKKTLRIWSAACATGQEAYSLAMILKDNAALLKGWKIELIATDISESAIEQAQRGIFTQFDIQRGVPVSYLVQFFEQINEKWRLRDDVRSMVKFSYCNLLDDISRLGPFDLIFCRNVLSYFSDDTKGVVLDRVARRLDKDGIMVLGRGETPHGLTTLLAPLPQKPTIFTTTGSHGSSLALGETKQA